MTRLDMEHHMFLQTLAARRIVSEREAHELLIKCFELAGYTGLGFVVEMKVQLCHCLFLTV